MSEKIDFAGRRKSRALALQGLYQFIVAKNEPDAIRLSLMDAPQYAHCDTEYFNALFNGATRDYGALVARLAPHLDRPIAEVSPVEQADLLLAAWELENRLEIPYKIILNEAVELAKTYGGPDGHKFVNGVLDKLAVELRPAEKA